MDEYKTGFTMDIEAYIKTSITGTVFSDSSRNITILLKK